ncbi:hypothetical protein GCM10022287_38200 [Gryllotalpicola koreensis]|uniref:Uncharacterized protein n=1 Tax=Gryllotalpicola koreensis TaxID=993086 RepID=A0ABP8AD51_9MICO
MRHRRAAHVRLDEQPGENGCLPHACRHHDRAVVLVVDLDLCVERRRALCGEAHGAHAHERVAEDVAVAQADPEQCGDRAEGENGADDEANKVAHGGALG